MTRLPPGPRGTLWHTLRLLREPYEHLRRCARRYGDPFTLPHAFGPIVMTGDPDGIQAIFAADPAIFAVPGAELVSPIMGQGSLIVMHGERHRAARQLLAPQFHGDRVRAHGEAIRAITLRHIERWRFDTPFAMQELTQAISLDVIIRSVFGVTDEADARELAEALIDVLTRSQAALAFFEPLRKNLFGLSPWARLQRAIARADTLVYRHIAARRASPDRGADVLGLLVAARHDDGTAPGDRELRDQLMTLLLAGYDAPAVILSWALLCLHRNPATLARLRAELDGLGKDPDADSLARLPYLEAVCHETMRLYPVLGSVIRRLTAPLHIKGYDIPAGMNVGAAAAIAHVRAESFPDPERFEPARFLERSASPFEYLPFGGGARRCIGAAFALHEMKIVLGTIVRHVALRLVPDQHVLPRTRGVAAVPSTGVRMVRVH